MKYLTLIRHAKSSWSDVSQHDFDRPLNQRGFSDAPMMGKRLVDAGTSFDLMISSPAKRALTTCQIIANEVGFPAKSVLKNDLMYEASTASLFSIISSLDNRFSQVALTGHNPAMSSLSHQLCEEVNRDLPTCSVVQLQFEIDAWKLIKPATARLLLFDYPKKG